MSEVVNELVEDMLDSMWLEKNAERIIAEGTISSEDMMESLGIGREKVCN